MNEDEKPDLSSLNLATCRALVGIDFVRPNEGGPDVLLRLVQAQKGRRDPLAEGDTDRPFSLLFRGPVDPRLTQGMHDLKSPHLDLPGLFLVPVDQDEDGFTYEAVFT